MTRTAWADAAGALVDELVAKGKLAAPEWISALRAVPRHEFVPSFSEQCKDDRGQNDRERDDRERDDQRRHRRAADEPGRDARAANGWREVAAESDPQRWWERVYSDVPLVTRLGALPGGGFGPTSSSSAPGLMARMLEALDVDDHCSVCEIGTGTGYNAAPLAHRLGGDRVFSVDVDADLVGTARERLRRLGWQPHLAVADGSAGWPHGGTFDRLIATCAVERVPPAWLHQTREGGLVLCDLKIGTGAGNLVALRRTGNGAHGRFVDGFAAFMPLRAGTPGAGTSGTAESTDQPHPHRDRAEARHRSTTNGASPWAEPLPWFLACLEMQHEVRFGYTVDERTGEPNTLFLSCPDGSWAEVGPSNDPGTRHVREAGPCDLWSTVERARDFCAAHGDPDWSRLGLTVTGRHHRIWLDDPDGPSWVLHDRTRRRC